MPQISPRQSPAFTRRDALRTVALTLGATALPAAFGFLSASARAATPSPSPSAASGPPPMAITSLGGKLNLLTGAGGNIAVFGGEDGVLAIDSGLQPVESRTAAEVAKSGRVALVVNTHWHYDHTGGNAALAEAGARIMAHENCRKRLSVDHFLEPLDMKIAAAPASGWPRLTFKDETTLYLNGDEIRLVPVAPAHTDGDVIVRFEKADVIHTGDLFFNGLYPFIDWSSGGWLGGMVAAAKIIAEMATEKTWIIPGHGPVATRPEFQTYRLFLETMQERLGKMKAEGRSVDEVVASAPAKEFDEKLGVGFLKPEQFVRITYTSLLKHE